MFLLPEFQSELDFKGKITGHSLDVAGSFGLWLTGKDAGVIDVEVLFYLQQNGDTMTLYYHQENKKLGKKFRTSAALTDVIASPTHEEVEKEIAMVKDVTVLHDNEKRRTLLVRLDGNKLADELEKSDAKSDTVADKIVNKFFGYIDTGIRKSNVWYTWTIDKQNRKTGTVVVDLSQIIQESERAVLNDSEFNLPDEFKEILETPSI